MKILKLAKEIAYKEIFTQYRIPDITYIHEDPFTGKSTTLIKDYYDWLEEFNVDYINYSYTRDTYNVFRNNSFEDLFEFFADQLHATYNSLLTEYKIKHEQEVITQILNNPGEQQTSDTKEPLIVKFNFNNDNNDGGSDPIN